MKTFTVALKDLGGVEEGKMRAGLTRNYGVYRVEISHFEGMARIYYEPRILNEAKLRKALATPDFSVPADAQRALSQWISQYGLGVRLTLSVILVGLSCGLAGARGPSYAWPDPLYLALNGAALLLAIPTLLRCFAGLLRDARASADLLMLVIAAAAVGTGHWLEAAVVVFISLLSEALRTAAFNPAQKGLTVSGVLGARQALVKDGETIRKVALQDIRKDQIVVVRQGQMIPVDGIVVAGKAEVHEAALTGESVYRARVPGHRVLAGGIVESGFIDVQAEKVGRETLLAHVDRLVNQALLHPAVRESFLDRFARVYVGAVLILGVIVFMVYGQFAFAAEEISTIEVLHRTLTLMLAVSPMALILAGPLTMYAGLLRAARRGILFKGAAVLETLARVTVLLLDKTGTLTYARPKVASVTTFAGGSEAELLDAALFVEKHSAHPIAEAIRDYGAQRKIAAEDAERFHEFEGGGACAMKGERYVKAGALWLMDDGREIAPEVTAWLEQARARGYTPVLVGDRKRILGGLALEDAIRDDARTVLQKLRKAGIRRLVMVTGDNRQTANRVQKAVGLDEVVSECMPDQKLTRLNNEKVGSVLVGMVGDGINDAPALAAADVGIAMSAMGSDMAIDAADVALLKNDLTGLQEAVVGSRQTAAAIRFGIGLAIVSNLVLLALALFEKIGLLGGAVLQGVVLALVGLNAAFLYLRKAR